MLKRFFSFSQLTLLVALSLSSVAAYYSIIGLTAIFAGAVVPVIIMGSILEVGKITTTVWLRKYWSRAGWMLKLYLVPAVIALALLTSMGIFGFLSKAHMEQGITSGDAGSKVALFDEKIIIQRENIKSDRAMLAQMDTQVNDIMSKGDSERSVERSVAIRKQQAPERAKILKDIEASNKEIQSLNEQRAPLASELRKVEAEVGPIKYIAALIYGDNADQNMLESAVRWVIILLVVGFDPLAIALVLAANASKEWDLEEPEDPVEDISEDGYKTPFPEYVADVTMPESIEEEPGPIERTVYEPDPFVEEASDPILDNCFKCGTPLVNAPGIGPFCPNKECDVADNTSDNTIVWKYIKPEPIVMALDKVDETTEEEDEAFDAIAETVQPAKEQVDPIQTSNVSVELYKKLENNYVEFEGKVMHERVLRDANPEWFNPNAMPVTTSFGTMFPDHAFRGDVFARTDVSPHRVFKFDGGTWIEINKLTTDSYLADNNYILELIELIAKGEYDPELLTQNEQAAIEEYVTAPPKG